MDRWATNDLDLALDLRLEIEAGKESQWTERKNERRCDLIDRDIDGTLTADEVTELEGLQNEMLAFRRTVAPLPIQEVRALYQQLLRMLSEPAREPN